MTHCHHAHDQGHDHDCDHARDGHDCVSAPLNGLSGNLKDASLSCCVLSGCATLSALSVSGGCVSAPPGIGSQKLHDCADDGQHPPGGNSMGQSMLTTGINLLTKIYILLTNIEVCLLHCFNSAETSAYQNEGQSQAHACQLAMIWCLVGMCQKCAKNVPEICQKCLNTVLELGKYLSRPCSSAETCCMMVTTILCHLLLSKSHL